MPREAIFPLSGTTPQPVFLLLMYKKGTDATIFELCACPLALFVTSLTLCGRAFLGSACHPMCGPRLRCDFLAAGATLTVAKRRSHDSAPTARS